MYHLFSVHSFATLHCALGVIQKLGLDFRDCVFIAGRDFKFPSLPEGITISVLTYPSLLNLGSWSNLIKIAKTIHTADEEIRLLVSNKIFHVYLPHSYYQASHLLMTHQLCGGFSYIEEGVTSYYGISEINNAYPSNIFRRRGNVLTKYLYARRLPLHCSFFNQDYTAAYGFSEDSFPGWDRRVTLGPPSYLQANGELQEGVSPVLVFDAVVERGLTQLPALLSGLKDYLEWLSEKGIAELRFKLHPGQHSTPSGRAVKATLQQSTALVRCIELSRETELEFLFAKESCEVHVLNSAAGIYAKIAGREVFSINSFIEGYDPLYAKATSLLPSYYRKMITSILERR